MALDVNEIRNGIREMLQLALDSVNCLNHFCRPLSESGIQLFCINCYRANRNNVEK